jgi:hypothetical protein
MGSSIPGNSCRTNQCWTPNVQVGCTLQLGGECVTYTGARIVGPGINTGDKLNIVISKIIDYVDNLPAPSSVISVTSEDFESDGITCNLPQLAGLEFEIFLNEVSRFLYFSTEWESIESGGFQILIPGFDASVDQYHLYIFTK